MFDDSMANNEGLLRMLVAIKRIMHSWNVCTVAVIKNSRIRASCGRFEPETSKIYILTKMLYNCACVVLKLSIIYNLLKKSIVSMTNTARASPRSILDKRQIFDGHIMLNDMVFHIP